MAYFFGSGAITLRRRLAINFKIILLEKYASIDAGQKVRRAVVVQLARNYAAMVRNASTVPLRLAGQVWVVD